ncbi:MAG: hypothetical protein IJH84_15390 [Saccharopolyspora sp.]|nr:DUF6879 family protein [Saccharopolyspora sp.]MBQ6642394.1 hypothetical protein [Saccharopolyspora sp.]
MQNYSGSSEDDALAEWRRTGRIPVTAELQQWCERTRHRVGQGCRIQRVHVVTEPLTGYVQLELASYAPNVQAGEEVRVIPVPEMSGRPTCTRRLLAHRRTQAVDDALFLGRRVARRRADHGSAVCRRCVRAVRGCDCAVNIVE